MNAIKKMINKLIFKLAVIITNYVNKNLVSYGTEFLILKDINKEPYEIKETDSYIILSKDNLQQYNEDTIVFDDKIILYGLEKNSKSRIDNSCYILLDKKQIVSLAPNSIRFRNSIYLEDIFDVDDSRIDNSEYILLDKSCIDKCVGNSIHIGNSLYLENILSVSKSRIDNPEYILLDKHYIDKRVGNSIHMGDSLYLEGILNINYSRIDNSEFVLLPKNMIESSSQSVIIFNKGVYLPENIDLDGMLLDAKRYIIMNKNASTLVSTNFLSDRNNLRQLFENKNNTNFIVTGNIYAFLKMSFLVSFYLKSTNLFNTNQKLIDTNHYNFYRLLENELSDIVYKQRSFGNKYKILNNLIEVKDLKSLKIVADEILFSEDYYFPSDKKDPVILDCGSNVGLAVMFYKHIYPESKVICFEPSNEMREILENNIKENKWTNIQVEPYALWNKDEQRIFVMPDDDSMAGHLEVSKDSRSLDDGNNHFEEVACVKLSHYLNQRIDFLKLDIEGSELEVLEESKELLGNVRYIFCEYHHDKEAPFLSKILQILEEKGFDVHVDKSHCFKVGTTYRPMTYLNNQQYKYSAVLYCVNKELM